ncbi:MAG: UDP-galactose-4-epimerase, partial [Daejeonella sp.]|nr:UDP-galactose-4-epimerase [Daejeonella sp.]
ADLNFDLTSGVPKLPTIDLVIHAAGKAHTELLTKKNIREYYDVNVSGTINLLKGLELNTLPKALVFISSVAVYGKESGRLINENNPLLATLPYGRSKIKAELIITNWCKEKKVICTIFRLPLVAGPNTPGNLGAMIKGIRNGYYINIKNGEAKKSIVLAKDIANIIKSAFEVGGIYNLTDRYHPSFKELSIVISSQLNKKPPISLPYSLVKVLSYLGNLFGKYAPINSKKFKKITSDLTFDDAKARQLINWDPTPVLSDFKIS